jgi:hypothetical protein
VNTNPISIALSLGFWIAVGAFACSSADGGTGNETSLATGGASSSRTSSNAGGSTGSTGTRTNGTGGSTTGTTRVAAGGKTSSSDEARGNTGDEAGGATVTGPKTSVGAGGRTSTNATKAGGATNAGGAKPTGGASSTNNTTEATGGASNAGGAKPTGGTSSTGGAQPAGGSSSAPTGSCTITKKSGDVSTNIGTVGIVTFSVSGASSLDSAEIKFGLDTNYGLSAPVDVSTAASDYRTLLLGMKTSKTYHYQIVGKSGSTECASPDYTIATGGCPTSIARPKIATSSGVTKDQLDGGFVVMEGYKSASDGNDYAYILDGDGDIVWCYKPSGFSDLTATRMSWDGKYMWIAHGNVPSMTAHMGRVAMDGSEFKDYSSQFSGLNHDALVLPNDEAVAYIAYSSSSCDDVKEFSPSTGTSKTIVNAGSVFSNSSACHCNAIKYDDSDKTYVVSDDDHSAYFKVGRDGRVKWVLGGGTYNQFDKSGGGASTWTGEHNMHLLGSDSAGLYHILFFNNGTSSTMASGVNAVIRELALDLTAKTTKEVWNYSAGISNAVMGDVQRLDNGNTFIAYSLAGVIHEVDASKKLLQTLTWSSGSIGYITKRKTLYGPSPR